MPSTHAQFSIELGRKKNETAEIRDRYTGVNLKRLLIPRLSIPSSMIAESE